MDVSENSGFSPQIIHFNRVFHDFHHTFWGTSISGWKHPNQQTSLSPKDWHFFVFLVHGSSSLPFFCPTKNVSQGSPNQTLASLRSATLLDAWITLFGGLLRVLHPMYWGPAEHFHWLHQWMKVNKRGSFDKTWIGHNNLYPLKISPRFGPLPMVDFCGTWVP